MTYETNCTSITAQKWDELMKGAKRANRKKVVKAAIETGVITEDEGRRELKSETYNPYEHLKTKTHLIYVHSAIEHFIKLD
jgi:hypothetical protein